MVSVVQVQGQSGRAEGVDFAQFACFQQHPGACMGLGGGNRLPHACEIHRELCHLLLAAFESLQATVEVTHFSPKSILSSVYSFSRNM